MHLNCSAKKSSQSPKETGMENVIFFFSYRLEVEASAGLWANQSFQKTLHRTNLSRSQRSHSEKGTWLYFILFRDFCSLKIMAKNPILKFSENLRNMACLVFPKMQQNLVWIRCNISRKLVKIYTCNMSPSLSAALLSRKPRPGTLTTSSSFSTSSRTGIIAHCFTFLLFSSKSRGVLWHLLWTAGF